MRKNVVTLLSELFLINLKVILQFEDEVSRNFQHVISMIELIWIHETFELNNNLKRLYVLDIFVCISLILKLQKSIRLW